jgi:hypothetical protein
MEHDPQAMLLKVMWKSLDEDQIRTLAIRMIDSKIKMKQARIAHLQDKIDTYCLARDMLEYGRKQ